MNRYVLLASASLGLISLSVGCQHSGTAENTTDENRPTMAESTPPPAETHATATPSGYTVPAAQDLSSYSVPYTTTTDTSYMKMSTDTASAGTFPRPRRR